METDESNVRGMTARELTDVLIRIGLLAALVVLCLRTFAPFVNLLMWALILAVTLYPVHLWLARRMGGKPGSAAIAVVLIGLLLIGAPTVMLGSSFASQVHESFSALQNGEIHVPTPNAAVAEWPVIGERLYLSLIHI